MSEDERYIRYQGREIQSTLKAPTEAQLDLMLAALQSYAEEFAMDEVEVLQKIKDPDGGWQAIVVAHNFNPLEWVKKKWEGRSGGPEARAEASEARRKAAQEIRLARIDAKRRARVAKEEAKGTEGARVASEKARLVADQAIGQEDVKTRSKVELSKIGAARKIGVSKARAEGRVRLAETAADRAVSLAETGSQRSVERLRRKPLDADEMSDMGILSGPGPMSMKEILS